MTSMHLIRSELAKLTTTRMPLTFGLVLIVMAAINGFAVAFGTDMDGSKTFISTAIDQQSLTAFAANSMMIAGLFGAIATAREYANNTVIGTYLATPNRPRALRAQLVAVGLGGAIIGLAGAAFTAVSVAISLPLTDHGFLISASGLAQVLGASAWAGAAGAVLGAGIGTVVRNMGGAVSGAVLILFVAPPLFVQMASGMADWVPNSLANVTSGVAEGTSTTTAILAIALWALVPAVAARISVQHRDVT